MTRDEILAQAKVGSIARVEFTGEIRSTCNGQVSFKGLDNYTIYIPLDWVVEVIPPPETDAQKIARLETRVRELEGQIAKPAVVSFRGPVQATGS